MVMALKSAAWREERTSSSAARQSEGLLHPSLDRRQEVRRLRLKSVSKLDDDVKSRVAASSLQSADVGAVQADVVREGLLRLPSVLTAQIAQTIAEGDAVGGDAHAFKDSDTLTMSPRTMSHIDVFGAMAVTSAFSGCSRDLEEP